jgi:hypothetical protein
MTRYRVLPYKQGSRSAKALATALGGKVLKLQGSQFIPKPSDKIINWGNTSVVLSGVLNPGALLQKCSNKLEFFRRMEVMNLEHCIPNWWTKKGDIPDDAFPIVCRTILAGHSGAGIVIADCRDDLVDAPLYVQYVKKKDEYRVHCGLNPDLSVSIIAVQRKARDTSCENPNWRVRNHSNGFVFVRNGFTPPTSVIDVAQSCFRATDLDFAAIDVIFNEHENKAYVLEANTAPGLEGQTITDYANFFQGGI